LVGQASISLQQTMRKLLSNSWHSMSSDRHLHELSVRGKTELQTHGHWELDPLVVMTDRVMSASSLEGVTALKYTKVLRNDGGRSRRVWIELCYRMAETLGDAEKNAMMVAW
jgi:hypothetical protein